MGRRIHRRKEKEITGYKLEQLNQLSKILFLNDSEKNILRAFLELKPNINFYMRDSSPREKNKFGEISRGFDIEISKFFVGKLREYGFAGAVITEELNVEGSRECTYIDPLDGSLNAARGLPFYGLIIGFSRKCSFEDVDFGIVWIIPYDVTIVGSRRKVIIVDRTWRIRELNNPYKKMDPDTIIETGDTVGDILGKIKKEGFSIRHFGSMAYSFYEMVIGVLDGIFDTSLKLKFTDVAGFIPIMRGLSINYEIVKKQVAGSFLNPNVIYIASPYTEVFNKLIEIFYENT